MDLGGRCFWFRVGVDGLNIPLSVGAQCVALPTNAIDCLGSFCKWQWLIFSDLQAVWGFTIGDRAGDVACILASLRTAMVDSVLSIPDSLGK